jgi:hypothetical protein
VTISDCTPVAFRDLPGAGESKIGLHYILWLWVADEVIKKLTSSILYFSSSILSNMKVNKI